MASKAGHQQSVKSRANHERTEMRIRRLVIFIGAPWRLMLLSATAAMLLTGLMVSFFDAPTDWQFRAAFIAIIVSCSISYTVARIVLAYEKVLARKNDQLETQTRELQMANQTLAQANDELDAFSRTVAHNLKSPMGTVVGYSEMLQQDFDRMSPEDVTNALNYMQSMSIKMSEIVDELLLLSQARKADIVLEPLNMTLVVNESIGRVYTSIHEYGAKIEQPDRWPECNGYEPWVEEVWVNYISNAIKYGGRPPLITLGADVLDQEFARFWVRDNGQGISQDAQSKLFMEFSRLPSTSSENGHGLGLSIAQRIIHRLGGIVGVESQVGQGSLFYFTLPLSKK